MFVMGLMSGTSSDGIDAALIDVRGGELRLKIKLLAFETFPYPPSLQKRLISLASNECLPVSTLCHLNFEIAEYFADATIKLAKQAKIPLSKIQLIGSHGQTVQHMPSAKRGLKKTLASTLQIGEPSVIAERTGITTVADFRPRDIAAGGEGAPLTPYLHYHLFKSQKKSRAIINIGGISNVTVLRAGDKIDQTIAFDMGPGNMLIDALVSQFSKNQKQFDKNGAMAKKGTVCNELLSDLLRHPFFKRKPPKSTGREMFGALMVEEILKKSEALDLSQNDVIATVTQYTAESIALNFKRFVLKTGNLDEVIVGGGGICNPVLMARLSETLAPIPVLTYENIGHHSRAIEAMTFAVLAYQSWHRRPSNIPSVTGARHPVVLGKIIPAGRTS